MGGRFSWEVALRLKMVAPEIPEDGFTGIDTFNRVHIADGLLSIARNVEDSFVVLLDAQWGAGKTFFLKQFQARAGQSGFPTIYLDAFRHDLTGDAFAALSGELLAYLDRERPRSKKAREQFLNSAAKVGKVALKGALGAGMAVATAGAINAKTLEYLIADDSAASGLAKELAEAVEGATEVAIEELLGKQAEVQSTLSAMKKALQAVCEEMLKKYKEERDRNPQQRIFFLVDELDRCRPNFALDVIECIKHFFDIDQVIFILSADSAQLMNSIKHVYGSEIDARTYFEKFHDIRIMLPSRLVRGTTLSAYAQYLKQSLPDDNEGNQYTGTLLDALVSLGDEYKLSLRTFEKVVQRFVIVLAQTDKSHGRVAPAVVMLCFCAVVFPDFYERLKSGNCTLAEYLEKFEVIHGSKENRSAKWMRGFFEFVLAPEGDQIDPDGGWYSWMVQYGFPDRQAILKIVAERFVEPIAFDQNSQRSLPAWS